MKRFSLPFVVLASLAALLGGGVLAHFGQSEAQATAAQTTLAALYEHSQGEVDAPVTMIEYSSLTCPHCADFNIKILPKLIEHYVNTGKLRIIYRDFPSDAYALRASVLARCLPDGQYLPFLHVLYSNLESWLKNPKPLDVLLRYAQMAGLDAERAQVCIDDNQLADALIALRQEAVERYKVEGTPAFIFNDGAQQIIGYRPYEDFARVIDDLFAQKTH
ncbi:MAG: DsbA family protein [Alphaproteobacteria bacterium]|nr:DsbA family protein [Alphaproteobacteria bacterium]